MSRFSGGNPAGIPDYKPQNPWGRPMPKPVRPVRERKPSTYQVHVECDGKVIPVGPRVVQPEIAEQFCIAINGMVSLGKEKRWSNAHVVEFQPEKASTQTLGDLLKTT